MTINNLQFHLHPLDCGNVCPEPGAPFPSPFSTQPHVVAQRAAEQLQQSLLQIQSTVQGRRFGVLVVRTQDGKCHYLAASSGADTRAYQPLHLVPEIVPDQTGQLRLQSFNHGPLNVSDIFPNPCNLTEPCDCAATRLLHFAAIHRLAPVALAEFWWGSSDNNQLYRHGQYYPCCRGKCHVLLPHMLQGVQVGQREIQYQDVHFDHLPVVYEDGDIIVVDKPAGMLSVPGKEIDDSVLVRICQMYPDATGGILLHRLDMATSGLLLAARHETAYHFLQKQFMSRRIRKAYTAILDNAPEDTPVEQQGSIRLPLRVNLEDRPRQMVCMHHGKPAHTRWKLLSRMDEAWRVEFEPVTGRTHQLRVHAAHFRGLNRPIRGDILYGTAAERLFLHAGCLSFMHPATEKTITIQSDSPF